LPQLDTLADVQAAIAAVLQGVANGQLTIEEGDMLANILERHGKAISDGSPSISSRPSPSMRLR
jgi:hypothetical protein